MLIILLFCARACVYVKARACVPTQILFSEMIFTVFSINLLTSLVIFKFLKLIKVKRRLEKMGENFINYFPR